MPNKGKEEASDSDGESNRLQTVTGSKQRKKAIRNAWNDLFIHEYSELAGDFLGGDTCLKFKRFKKFMVIVDGEKEWYYPYKLAWLHEHERYAVGSISHLCGNERCANVNHLVEENISINLSRRSCHHKIRKWVNEHKQPNQSMYGKYTFRRIFGERCQHYKKKKGKIEGKKECFLMIGPERSHKSETTRRSWRRKSSRDVRRSVRLKNNKRN